MKTALVALLMAAFAALAVLAYVRLAPSDARRWHVDPLSARRPKTPNAFLLLPGDPKGAPPEYALDAGALAAAFDAFALAQPRVRRLAVSEDGLLATYVIRTRLIGYPDYLSIRFIPRDGGGSTLAAFSRARFGYGDRGVNRKRLLGWLKAFHPE